MDIHVLITVRCIARCLNLETILVKNGIIDVDMNSKLFVILFHSIVVFSNYSVKIYT